MKSKNLIPSFTLLLCICLTGCAKKKFDHTPSEDENNPTSGTTNITGTNWVSVQGCPVLPNSRLKAIAALEGNLIYTFITAENISGRFDGANFYLGTQSVWDFGSGGGIEELVFANGKMYGLAALGGHGALVYDPNAYWSWGEVVSGGLYTLGTNGQAIAEYQDRIIVGCWSAPYIREESDDDWVELGGGLDGGVYDLELFGDDLIACGSFDFSGPTVLNGVAKWDGANWLPLGEGLTGGTVIDLVVFNNQLIAIGKFTQSGAGNTNCRYVAMWDGTSWNDLGGGLVGGNNGALKAIVFENQLFIAGDFESAGGQLSKNIIKWTDNGWESLPGIDVPVGDIAVFNNHLYAVNAFEIANGNFLYRLD